MINYELEELDYQIIGEGDPPILMLHGWGGSLQTMDVLGEPLAQHRRVVFVSLPGFGSSPEPPESWGTWDFVGLLKDWLERQGLKRIDVIGHSFGGRIAIGLAIKHPHFIEKLILMDSAGLRPHRSLTTRLKIMTAHNLKRVGRVMHGRFEKFMDRWRDQLGSMDWKLASPVMRRTLVRIIEEDLSVELGNIKASTLLVWGEKDTATPLPMGRKMARLIPNSSLVIIPGSGHFCYLERKGDVLSAVWKHLELSTAW